MVTGDYHHTALAVARGVGMVPTDSPLVIVQSQTEFRPSPKGLATMPSALKSPKPAGHAAHQAVTSGVRGQQEETQALEGCVALPSSQMGPRPALHAAHHAVSFGTQEQQEEEHAPEGLLAVPSLGISPGPALPSPNRAVSFETKRQQGEGKAPVGSLATASSLKRPRLSPLNTRASRRSVSFRLKGIKPEEEEEQAPEGQLRFQLDNGDVFEDGDALRAFTSIAQVNLCAKKTDSFDSSNQCCVVTATQLQVSQHCACPSTDGLINKSRSCQRPCFVACTQVPKSDCRVVGDEQSCGNATCVNSSLLGLN